MKGKVRTFTTDDIRAIRETRRFAGLANLARIHDLTEAQLYAITNPEMSRVRPRLTLSAEEVAGKLHLLTDDLVTNGEVWRIYGVWYG